MKAKKITKKLAFNKTTVANLENAAMDGIRGGIYTVRYTCGYDCDTYFTCARETICDDCWTVDPPICN